MLAFEVNDMTCGHCASTITKAVTAIDPGADVQVDLTRHVVNVVTAADAGVVQKAISDAGYSPTQVNAPKSDVPASKKGGCSCGTR
ncbi:heavy-metal-associated domain-containing protein [Aquabacterium sp.]|jgi:copper chaperone|uniref:heavy-metal-associated domain-containing protein n=1 Tax=Aquabacterium sp. TaxID=1872578 RepID=UPI0027BAA9BE|nr:heavy-metal-associated domain-containing protein [Aquabacterium sp.]